MIQFLTKCLANIKTEWGKWRFFFCDERVLPIDDAESTYGIYRTNLIGNIPVTEDQFIKIDPNYSGALMI